MAPDGKLISHYEDAFNDNYQLVSNRKLLDDGSYASLTCSYGTHGFVTKREESHKGKLYNIEFTYELDDRGNWTKRTEIVNANEHHETKERAIEYYR